MKPYLLPVIFLLTACAGDDGTTTGWNLDDPPRTVFTTNEFEVGELYTLGSTGVPEEVPRPFVITGIGVLASANIEIIGRGVFQSDSEGVGLVPDWPPDMRSGRVDLRALEDGTEWEGNVSPILGIRTTAPKSGLRGVVVSWIDGEGNPQDIRPRRPDVRARRMRPRLERGRLALEGAGPAQPLDPRATVS